MRLLIAFCVGIGATLAWLSYGDEAIGMIASSYPELRWLAPQSAFARSVRIVPTSPDPQELKKLSVSLAAMRQRIDQLAASQDQATKDVATRLQVTKQEILDKIPASSSQPAAPTARKPAPPVATSSR